MVKTNCLKGNFVLNKGYRKLTINRRTVLICVRLRNMKRTKSTGKGKKRNDSPQEAIESYLKMILKKAAG
jgi:hypothetical protein